MNSLLRSRPKSPQPLLVVPGCFPSRRALCYDWANAVGHRFTLIVQVWESAKFQSPCVELQPLSKLGSGHRFRWTSPVAAASAVPTTTSSYVLCPVGFCLSGCLWLGLHARIYAFYFPQHRGETNSRCEHIGALGAGAHEDETYLLMNGKMPRQWIFMTN